MKRTIWAGVVATLVAIAAAVPLAAQPPQGPGGRGPGRGGFAAPGGPGGPGMPFPILRELNLTDEQREQIRTLTEQRRSQSNNPQRKVADLERSLQLALFADAPDQQKIDELKSAIAAATAEELSARIELETKLAQILTPEQRAQAREAFDRVGPPRGRGW